MQSGVKLALMLAIGFLLIMAGFRGRLGSILGAIFTPSYMAQSTPTSTTGGTAGFQPNPFGGPTLG